MWSALRSFVLLVPGSSCFLNLRAALRCGRIFVRCFRGIEIVSESESVGYCRLGETLFTSVFIADFQLEENRCFPCVMVVDKEIIAKICSLITEIEREGYFSTWLVGCRRATQRAVTTAVRKEGLLLCCCTCSRVF